jgi:microcystin-dependent protein
MGLNKLNHNYNQPLNVIGFTSKYANVNNLLVQAATLASASVSALNASTFTATSADIGNVSNRELQFLDGATSNIQTQLNALSGVGGVPAGSLTMYAGATAPSGWLLCNGASVSRATYSTLFGIVGSTYGGGDGSSTFNLPDFRGRAPIGAGTGAGSSTGAFTTGAPTGTALDARTLGTWGGAQTHVLTIAQLASHSHPGQIVFGSGGGGSSAVVPSGNNPQAQPTTGSTGSNEAHNNMQPSLVVNFIIKT